MRPHIEELSEKAAPDLLETEIPLAVVGAHLRGQPLNAQLTDLGGRFVRATHTAADYRLYALAETLPAKPGLVRVAAGTGAAIEVEIWTLPRTAFGSFFAQIKAPLGLGTLLLEDGQTTAGFLCEAVAITSARDITAFGGWRAFLAAR